MKLKLMSETVVLSKMLSKIYCTLNGKLELESVDSKVWQADLHLVEDDLLVELESLRST